MKFLEKTLEDIIYDTPADEIFKRGLTVQGKCYRQLKIGNYGIADLIYVRKDYEIDYVKDLYRNPSLVINVIELKKNKININTFLQALGYCKGISRYLKLRGFTRFCFEITLIGQTIDESDSFCYLTDLIAPSYDLHYRLEEFHDSIMNLSFFTYNYQFDGIRFNKINGYKLTDEGFIKKSNQ
jgi:hypothetical protein